jgi:hypothetical protein
MQELVDQQDGEQAAGGGNGETVAAEFDTEN